MNTDEHTLADTTPALLAILKPVVRADGTVIAGNASGVNDLAATIIVASAGVPPRVMGIGPVPSVRKLAARLRLTLDVIDAVEPSEAFASQGLAALRELGIANGDVRVNAAGGGAIALGHPLGMSGARIAMTLVHYPERSRGRSGLAKLCIGVGQGLAAERV